MSGSNKTQYAVTLQYVIVKHKLRNNFFSFLLLLLKLNKPQTNYLKINYSHIYNVRLIVRICEIKNKYILTAI